MADVWLLALAVAALLVMVTVLVREGVFLTPQTVTIRRLRVRLGGRPTVVDSVLASTGLLSLLQNEADIRRLQAVAGRGSDPRTFVRRVVRVAVIATMIPVLGDVWSVLNGNDVAIAPLYFPLFAVGGALLTFADLRRTAARRRDDASQSVTKMLLLFGMTQAAPVRSGAHVEAGDPLLTLAGALRQPALREMLEGEAWHQLIKREPRSRAELLEALGAAYGIPVFAQLAQVVRTVQEYGGTDAGSEYTTLARAITAQRLADARVRLGSRTVTVLIPATGLLLAIFVVIFSAIAYTSAHGGL